MSHGPYIPAYASFKRRQAAALKKTWRLNSGLLISLLPSLVMFMLRSRLKMIVAMRTSNHILVYMWWRRFPLVDPRLDGDCRPDFESRPWLCDADGECTTNITKEAHLLNANSEPEPAIFELHKLGSIVSNSKPATPTYSGADQEQTRQLSILRRHTRLSGKNHMMLSCTIAN